VEVEVVEVRLPLKQIYLVERAEEEMVVLLQVMRHLEQQTQEEEVEAQTQQDTEATEVQAS
jgi:hypothetical protein